VVVLTSARVEEYEEAIRGFKGTIPHQIVAVYDMDGDLDRGRNQLAEIESKVKPDLIFAVGIWALQVVVSRPPTTPVVYAMVLNPPAVIGADTKNITGASINVPVEQQIWLFKQWYRTSTCGASSEPSTTRWRYGARQRLSRLRRRLVQAATV